MIYVKHNIPHTYYFLQSKKKRRDFLKEFLKNAGVGRGSAVPEGKRIEASVLDIRQRMVPQL